MANDMVTEQTIDSELATAGLPVLVRRGLWVILEVRGLNIECMRAAGFEITTEQGCACIDFAILRNAAALRALQRFRARPEPVRLFATLRR